MEINRTKRLIAGQAYGAIYPKKQIFWHHTAGTTADGAISWWNQTPDAVGTAYVIDRDGTIFEVFSPSGWAYHLGITAANGGDINNLDEKESIGIEIVSAGHLYNDGKGNFVQYPLYPNKAGAKIIPNEEVWDLGEDVKWRGNRFFHSYTDEQINSLIWLTKKLSVDYKIPLPMKIDGIFEYNKDVVTKRTPGLWSHTTVRKDKDDVVPYKPFIDKVNKALSSAEKIKVEPTSKK